MLHITCPKGTTNSEGYMSFMPQGQLLISANWEEGLALTIFTIELQFVMSTLNHLDNFSTIILKLRVKDKLVILSALIGIVQLEIVRPKYL